MNGEAWRCGPKPNFQTQPGGGGGGGPSSTASSSVSAASTVSASEGRHWPIECGGAYRSCAHRLLRILNLGGRLQSEVVHGRVVSAAAAAGIERVSSSLRLHKFRPEELNDFTISPPRGQARVQSACSKRSAWPETGRHNTTRREAEHVLVVLISVDRVHMKSMTVNEVIMYTIFTRWLEWNVWNAAAPGIGFYFFPHPRRVPLLGWLITSIQ